LASNFLCLLSDIDNSYRPKTLPSTLLILPWTGPDFGVSDVLAFWFPSLSPPRRRCLKARRIPLVSPPVAVEVAEDEDDTDFAVDDPSPSSALRLAAFFSSMFLIIFDFSILFMINLFSRLAWLISACNLWAREAFSYAIGKLKWMIGVSITCKKSVHPKERHKRTKKKKKLTNSLSQMVPLEFW